MKKISFFIALMAVIVFNSSCGPAAEDREAMYARAKVFQDSIANVLKSSMAEAEAPGPAAVAAPASTPAASQPTPGK